MSWIILAKGESSARNIPTTKLRAPAMYVATSVDKSSMFCRRASSSDLEQPESKLLLLVIEAVAVLGQHESGPRG